MKEENIIFQVASISLVILTIGEIWKSFKNLLNLSSPPYQGVQVEKLAFLEN
jgi:hypothetical protein